ncbi:helix-turn-helix domain-containing protein [Pseudacidovorax intermedius]|uniref:helix-turn-helix domain-containing protein n=1 Tax=Pseudacidovorax intermedius TaxID=433924 RepID=UPI0009E6BA60|nr:helix-turn-helix domain-containing protein [Pseudacidovorax intermedius]
MNQATHPDVVLEAWTAAAAGPRRFLVLPDGCHDLILHLGDGPDAASWQVSPLDDAARRVDSPGTGRWFGWRLRPGTRVMQPLLLQSVAQLGRDLPIDANALQGQVASRLADFCRTDPRVDEALAAVAGATHVAAAGRALGVSERSLQRLITPATGHPPAFWRSLARIRGAVRALAGPAPLSAIAADHGFADQAHFSRECRRWMGQPPARLRRDVQALRTATASGYG